MRSLRKLTVSVKDFFTEGSLRKKPDTVTVTCRDSTNMSPVTGTEKLDAELSPQAFSAEGIVSTLHFCGLALVLFRHLEPVLLKLKVSTIMVLVSVVLLHVPVLQSSVVDPVPFNICMLSLTPSESESICLKP